MDKVLLDTFLTKRLKLAFVSVQAGTVSTWQQLNRPIQGVNTT